MFRSVRESLGDGSWWWLFTKCGPASSEFWKRQRLDVETPAFEAWQHSVVLAKVVEAFFDHDFGQSLPVFKVAPQSE